MLRRSKRGQSVSNFKVRKRIIAYATSTGYTVTFQFFLIILLILTPHIHTHRSKNIDRVCSCAFNVPINTL